LRGFEEIRAHTGAEVLRLADVNDLALCVLVEITSGAGGEGADFFVKIHIRKVVSEACKTRLLSSVDATESA
jgi:hypothetical protein